VSKRQRAATLPIVGLIVLAVITAIVSIVALLQYRPGKQTAIPPTASAPQTSQTDETPTPSEPATPQPTTATALDHFATAFAQGHSVLVFGDGTGNEDDEWVSIWARDHVAHARATEYVLWDRDMAVWGAPVALSSAGQPMTVWNASIRSPQLDYETTRVAQAWQNVDAVLLSYGHVQTADVIAADLQAILDAVRVQSPTVPVAVILQNPDPTATADQQQATVAAIASWAHAQDLATIDVYAGFPQNQAERDALVELDGSPNEQGSQLFARIVADALPLA